MRKFVIALMLLLFVGKLSAGEGMWIPMLLGDWNEKEMQSMGMRLTAEDIYSINHSSLKDGIVLFGSGCTAEIVSDQGLLFTNHHCGYGSIQKHSSLENDYLTNGFWALNQAEELPNPGLTVTMLMKMEDVTQQILIGITDKMTEQERYQKIDENSKVLTKQAKELSGWDAEVKPFFQDNQFYLLYTQTFKDIRLVGAPPSLIGKFGGDTDNWMWPRHTGDFSVFRIYVGKDNKAADYSADNQPYKPNFHFPISLKGVDEGDFTFVYGYPARTSEYLSSFAVKMVTEESNPHRINLRQKRLDIYGKYAANNPVVRIQYASKDAGVANGWKKMIGESRGINRLNGIEKKKDFETSFMQWANTEETLKNQYAGLIPAFESTYQEYSPIKIAADFLTEAGLGIELLNFTNRFKALVDESTKDQPDQKKIDEMVAGLLRQTETHFKDYYQPIDREVATELLWYYINNQAAGFRPDFLNKLNAGSKSYTADYVNRLFEKSLFAQKESVVALLTDFSKKKVKKIIQDPAYQIVMSQRAFSETRIQPFVKTLGTRIDSLQRIYMQGQMEMQCDKRFYPDANFTLRITYGKVGGFEPADGVYYDYFTTLDGIIEKDDPDVMDYRIDARLKQLYSDHDFGIYADKEGQMRVAFTASNHTTGGNSGSPVMNAEGQLVGINFDRCWEGTMSDLMYDPAVCRNISVDIRYVLFVIDKYAGAGHLIKEMTLIE
jgi:hypothetical protein